MPTVNRTFVNTTLLSALAATALLFVTACAGREPAPVTTSTTTTENQQVPAPIAPATTTTVTQQVHTY
jgi:hypothetical protein